MRAVLFDMDGVLRHWHHDHSLRIEVDLGLPPGSIAEAAFGVAEFEASMCGRATHQQWAGSTRAALVDRHGAAVAPAVDRWLEYRGDMDAEMLDVVRRVRGEVPVALVSNATDRLRDDLAHHGLADAFDLVVNSAEIGTAKPDRQIFLAASAGLGVTVEHCFFTDDRPENVAGARLAGLQAEVFTGREQLVEQLRGVGVPLG